MDQRTSLAKARFFIGGKYNMERQTTLLSRTQVIEITSLSSTTIWRMMKQGTFPKSVKASMRRVAWRKEDIDKWLAEHI